MSSVQNKVAVAVAALVAVAAIAWLAFGYFGVQAAFTDTEVDEAGPAFDSGVSSDTGPDGSGDASDELQSAPADSEGNAIEVEPEAVEDTATEVVTVASGQFTATEGHEVVGQAQVLNDGSEQRFLRFEGFESTNGPDLNVYLRADDGEFVDLGDLKGNVGDQNYEIPPDVDLARFNTVQIWCVRFSVLFGDALLA